MLLPDIQIGMYEIQNSFHYWAVLSSGVWTTGLKLLTLNSSNDEGQSLDLVGWGEGLIKRLLSHIIEIYHVAILGISTSSLSVDHSVCTEFNVGPLEMRIF